MYFRDNRRHHLPHIHVRYQDLEAAISIEDGERRRFDMRPLLTMRPWNTIAGALDNPERGVVTWPNGADLDSDQLHAWAQGLHAPEWAAAML